MKKLLSVLSAFILVFALALGGCSCVTSIPLSFNYDFNGGGTSSSDNNLSNTYTEVLTYDVELSTDYNDTLKRDPLITDDIAPDYSGTFVLTFKGDGNVLPSGVTSDISFSEGDFHYLRSQLDLTVSVNGKTYDDKVISEVYFYSAGHSFAPVYAKTTLKNTYMTFNPETKEISALQNIYEYTTVYNVGSYKMVRKFYDVPNDVDLSGVDITNLDQSKMSNLENERIYNYTMKEVIDTTQLLFAIRCLGLAEKESRALPTVAPTYGDSKTLAVINENEEMLDVDFVATVDGEKVKQSDNVTDAPSSFKMPVKNLSFAISGSDNAGKKQFVTLQKAKSDNFNCYRALPVVYAETLFEYGNFLSLGALKYSLNKMEVIN